MDWSGTSDFLSVDADLDLGHAQSLTASLTPRFVVVRMDQRSAAADDDEDEDKEATDLSGFFVVDAGALSELPASTSMAATIGEFVVREQYPPALAIDTDDGWLAASGTVGTDADLHAVVLGDDGIVTEVVPNLRITDSADGEAFDSPVVLPNQRWQHLHTAITDLIVPGLTAFTALGDSGLDDLGGPSEGAQGAGVGEAMALEVEFPDTVRLGDEAQLLVKLSLGPGGPDSAPIMATAGEVLEIMVSPTSGFTLVDKPVKKMTVVFDGETLPVKFVLLADLEGKGAAKVYAFRQGECVASLTVSASIVTTELDGGGGAPTTVKLPATAKVIADLDLMVLRESFRGGHALRYRLTSDGNRSASDFGPHPLDDKPSKYVHDAFGEIEKMTADHGRFGNAERLRLERIGADLYESLVPHDLQTVLWESNRVRSFLVQTEEPWIPWELCRMTVSRDGRTESRGFLCELFDMSRWLPGVEPKPTLRATRVGVIAPLDSGLPNRKAEVAMLEALAKSGPVVEPVKATYESTIIALGSHRFDVLHFVGHGENVDPENATRSQFRLSGRWRLTPSDISGETRNLGLSTPIVFMNACQVAQGSMALSGVGGWGPALMRAGAGAFVGTHWNVRDDLAHLFATKFYDRLVGGASVAGAVREARQALLARTDGDATWLAYTVHASPGASCTFAKPAA